MPGRRDKLDSETPMSIRDFRLGLAIAWVTLLVGGLFIFALGIGWIPILVRAPSYYRIVLMVMGASGVIYCLSLAGFVTLFRGEPLRVTQEGLYLPALRLYFKKEARQKFLHADKIERITIPPYKWGSKITIVTTGGKKIRVICNEEVHKKLERFWQSHQAPDS